MPVQQQLNFRTDRLGEKLILWVVKYIHNAYTDQFGISHWGYVVLNELPVTIVKKCDCIDSHGNHYLGYKALTEDGHIEFRLNWNDDPDKRYEPSNCWYGPSGGRVDVRDACKAYNDPHVYASKDGQPIKPTGVVICEIHNQVYMPNDPSGCYYCKYGIEK